MVTSADRLDIVLGLLAAQLSVHGPGVAGVLLTQAGTQRAGRNYARWVNGGRAYQPHCAAPHT